MVKVKINMSIHINARKSNALVLVNVGSLVLLQLYNIRELAA